MRTTLSLSLLTALALGGCSGDIMEPNGGELDPDDPNFCREAPRVPGYVTLHRLNRVEYDNTIEALLFDDSHPASSPAFPDDVRTKDGFTNNADALTVDTVLVDIYAATATTLAEAAASRDLFRESYLGACDPAVDGVDMCARAFVESFAPRAFRRALTADDLDRYVGILVDGASDRGFDGGLQLAIRAMLLSPDFLFRAESHGVGIRDLDGYELASRLSYFLWSSMPDDTLFDLAESGRLQDADVLRAQVTRMLDDERSDALLEEFAARWLEVDTHRMHTLEPAAELFPDFDHTLRDAMAAETRMFIRHVIRENLPLATLLNADFTYLNERLAAHYDIEGVTGDEMRLVNLAPDSHRGGILRQGAVLMTTSHPNRTSPVLRGKFILERLLCVHLLPPPDDVDALPENTMDPDTGEVLTLRERLEQHREDPDCAQCHDAMDPVGLALENFDATGAWRTEEFGEPIDPSGILPSGEELAGVDDLGAVLAADPDLAQCITQKLVTYGLGRAIDERADKCFLEDIVADARERGPDVTLRNLIESFVVNDLFRTVGTLEGDE